MKRILVNLHPILLGVLFCLDALGTSTRSRPEKPVAFVTEKPERRDVKKTVANGSVVPRQEIDQAAGQRHHQEIYVRPATPWPRTRLPRSDHSGHGGIDQRREPRAPGAHRGRGRPAHLRPQQAVAGQGVISDAEFQTYRSRWRTPRRNCAARRDNPPGHRARRRRTGSSGATLTLVRSTINGMVLDVPVKGGQQRDPGQQLQRGHHHRQRPDMNDPSSKASWTRQKWARCGWACPSCSPSAPSTTPPGEAELEYRPRGVEEEGAIQFEIRAAVKLDEGQRAPRRLQRQRRHRTGPARQRARSPKA